MKEKKLINSLLRSKATWWSRLWNRIKSIRNYVLKESKDSSYQASLVSIREQLVRNNSIADGKDPAYQVYLDKVKEYLVANGQRLLTEKEEKAVMAHLITSASAYCRDPRIAKGLGIKQVLAVETAKMVGGLHPGFPVLTEEEEAQKVEEVLAIRNLLADEK